MSRRRTFLLSLLVAIPLATSSLPAAPGGAVPPAVRAMIHERIDGFRFAVDYERATRELLEVALRAQAAIPEDTDEHLVLTQAIRAARRMHQEKMAMSAHNPVPKAYHHALLSVLQALAAEDDQPFLQRLALRGLANSRMGLLTGTLGRDVLSLGFLPAWRLAKGGRLGGAAQQLTLVVEAVRTVVERSGDPALQEEFRVLESSYLSGEDFYGHTPDDLRKVLEGLARFMERLEPTRSRRDRRQAAFSALHAE